MLEATHFSTTQAARLSGLPAPTLRRWARSGLLQASGGKAGGRWRWSFTDLLGLRVLAMLVHEHALGAARLRALLPELQRLGGGGSALGALARSQLAVTGDRVLLLDTEAAYTGLVELFDTPGQQVLGIFPLEQVIWDVQLRLQAGAGEDAELAAAERALRSSGDWRVA